jgi:hypothetical protein
MAQILDIGLSIAFSFLGNLLKPRQVDKSPDSLPNPQFGTKLYKGWGTFMCPGMLVYALPPALNNPVQLDKYNWSNPEEASSYASFLIANPSAPLLRAIRVNGKISASNLQALPISAEFKGFRVTDGVTGLQRVNDFKFRFLNGTQLSPDPIFTKGSNPELVYKGQSVLVVDSSLRAIYGGRGSSVSSVMQNKTTGNTVPTALSWGSGNSPASVSFNVPGVRSGIYGISFPTSTNKVVVVPNGFQFSQALALFDSPASILSNGAKQGTFIFGTGTEYFAIKSNSIPVFTINQGGLGLTPAGSPGNNSRVAYTSALPVVFTNVVIVASVENTTRKIILGSSQNSPFYAVNGNIKNSAGLTIGTCGLNEVVVGWNNTVFTRSAPVTNAQSPPVGSAYAVTDLESIFTDLLVDSGLSFSFGSGFNETLIGFITNRSDISTDLSNLMAIFRKIVYQKRDGTIVFSAYPTAEPTLEIKTNLHVTPPEITISSKDQISDVVNFSYRSVEAEFDSRSIRVGGDTDRVTDFTIEVTATAQQAGLYARRLRNYQLTQTITGSLHLHPVANTIEAGDTYILKALSASGQDLKILIVRVETGVDNTVKADFIVWVPFVFLDINDSAVGLNPTPSITRLPKRALIDTEPRSNKVGLTYYTESNAPALFNSLSITPIVSNLAGRVDDISSGVMTVITPGQTPVINTEYYVYDLLDGEGSWIKVLTVTSVSSDTYDLTYESGLYASRPLITYPPTSEYTIISVSELTTDNDNYVSNSFQQSGFLETWTYNTLKRTREPFVSGFTASAGLITFNRQSSLLIDDGDLGDAVVLPLVFFEVKNVTTSLFTLISGSTATLNASLVFTSGNIITIKQTDSAGVVLPYAVVNTFNVL